MDANEDECIMDDIVHEEDEDSKSIVDDQPVLTSEGGGRKALLQKLYDYCIGRQSQV